jgi:hypothetical protein
MAHLYPVSRSLALVASLMVVEVCGLSRLEAQAPNAPEGAAVEVRSVKFTTLRAPGTNETWLEATVEVTVTATPGAGPAGRFADRVKVTLNLSLNPEGTGFFRTSAEAVSLEAGRSAFRFYLPPEVVRREQVNTDPYAYAVEVAVRGRAEAVSPDAVSSNVRSAEALRSFKDRVAQAAPLNDGVLVPQYLSPFAGNAGSDTPSFVRRER